MTPKIVKSTSKGQITLPMNWRNKFGTDNYLLEIEDKQIIIKPFQISHGAAEEVIFDADRDNKGKGVSVDTMIKMLKKMK